MASVTALIKFTQGVAGIPGQVFVGTAPGPLVSIANNVNTNVNSWQIDLVYTPPGSAVPVATLAFNDNSPTPAATFTPDVPGSYRIVLTVWAVINRTGTNYDVDIRNFVVPLPSGLVIPPYQKDPDRLPTLASGDPGAKPNEMNINGTELGWAGDGTDGLLAEAIALISGGGGGSLATTLGIGNTTGVDAYTSGNPILLSAGDSLTTAEGLNPGDSGITLSILAGPANTTAGPTATGGAIDITAGQGASLAGGTGGAVTISGGSGGGPGSGGAVNLFGGNSGGSTGDGGNIQVVAGGSNQLFGGVGGQLLLAAGDSYNGPGGDITLKVGGDTVTGLSGKVKYQHGVFNTTFLTIDPVSTALPYSGVNISFGETAGDVLITHDPHTLVPNTPGYATSIVGQDGDGSGNGGNARVIAGDSGTGTGGLLLLSSGQSYSGTPGDVYINVARDTVSSVAGKVLFDAASSTYLTIDPTLTGVNLTFAETALDILLTQDPQTAGNVSGSNLSFLAQTGSGTGDGGAIGITGGASGTGATGNGGAVNITAGSATSTDGDGGDIVLTPGAKTGTGTVGEVHVVGKLTVDGLIDPTGLVLDEQASAPFNPTGLNKGLIYVKTGAPNTLWFRNDAGTDTQVQVGTPSLASTLVAGSTTGTDAYTLGTDITLSSGNSLKTAAGQSPGNSGVALVIRSGAGNTTGTGGSALLSGGNGGATGAGGAVTIEGGSAASGAGGAVTITVPNSTGTNIAGSSLTLQAGNGSGTSTAGSVVLVHGTSTSNGAINFCYGSSISRFLSVHRNSSSQINIYLDTGSTTGVTNTFGYVNTSDGAGNTLSITGQYGEASSNGGAISIIAGAGGASAGTGGSATFQAGTGGAGTGGAVAVRGGFQSSTGTGGTATLEGGGATSGAGGAVTVQGGETLSGNGGAVTLQGRTAVGGNNAGGTVTITGGTATGTGTAGTVDITAGASGTGATGNGAKAEMRGGASQATNGDGGVSRVRGGAGIGTGSGGGADIIGGAGGATGVGGIALVRGGTSAGSSGGDAQLEGGASTTAAGGNVTITGGDGSTVGGTITLTPGSSPSSGADVTINGGPSSSSGAGGAVAIRGGIPTSGPGGVVTIYAAAGVGTNQNGGVVVLKPGARTGSGTTGYIALQDSASATKFEVNTTGIGFFATAPVAQPTDLVALTDSSTGTATNTINDVGAVPTQAAINDNFASVTAKINGLRTRLRDLGLMA